MVVMIYNLGSFQFFLARVLLGIEHFDMAAFNMPANGSENVFICITTISKLYCHCYKLSMPSIQIYSKKIQHWNLIFKKLLMSRPF